MSLNIKFWGVRGSLPSSMIPYEWRAHIQSLMNEFFNRGLNSKQQIDGYLNSLEVPVVGGYGASTTCVEVASPRMRLLVDGGSGIRKFSEKVMRGQTGSVKGPFHIFMTHFHWDHMMGLPFFAPHFIPKTEIHYYAVQPELEKMVRGIFKKPYFPVAFEALPSNIHFHSLEPRKTLSFEDLEITPYQLDHPDPCWGYKIQSGGATYSHCVDTECTRVSPQELAEDLPLYQGVDLMYFDAQYTFPELAEKANWGHSAAQIGLDICFREGVKRILFAHHDPGATIEQVQHLKKQTLDYYRWRMDHAKASHQSLPKVEWDFVCEGHEVQLS